VQGSAVRPYRRAAAEARAPRRALEIARNVEPRLDGAEHAAALAVELREVLLLALPRRRDEQRPFAERGTFHQRRIAGAADNHPCPCEHLALGAPVEVAMNRRIADPAHVAGGARPAQCDHAATVKRRQGREHALRQHRVVRLDAGDREEVVDVLANRFAAELRERAEVDEASRPPVEFEIVREVAGKRVGAVDVGHEDRAVAFQQVPLRALHGALEPCGPPGNDLAQRMKEAVARHLARPDAEPAVGYDGVDAPRAHQPLGEALLELEAQPHPGYREAHAQIEDRRIAAERLRQVFVFMELAGIAELGAQQRESGALSHQDRDGVAALEQRADQHETARRMPQAPVVNREQDSASHRSASSAGAATTYHDERGVDSHAGTSGVHRDSRYAAASAVAGGGSLPGRAARDRSAVRPARSLQRRIPARPRAAPSG
jgi:hypothetical protein